MLLVGLFLFVLMLLPEAVMAHQVNGTVRYPDGQPVQDEVVIDCPSQNERQRTDRYGNFGFFIRNIGRCTLRVGGATYPVYSSQNPVRYDLILDGGALRRR
jgi:hypothetical protein